MLEHCPGPKPKGERGRIVFMLRVLALTQAEVKNTVNNRPSFLAPCSVSSGGWHLRRPPSDANVSLALTALEHPNYSNARVTLISLVNANDPATCKSRRGTTEQNGDF